MSALEGRRIEVAGTVQGVGFRPFVYRVARASGVTGRVRNDSAGVTIEAFGEHERLDAFVASLEAQPPRAARIRSLVSTPIPAEPTNGFEIVESAPTAERQVSIPPDLATCDACLAEIFDANDRRFRYPFTNCTNCGPRFTITRDIPYDRPATTMAPFTMCPDCLREYEDVEDRRFHAQPNACPVCGPRLKLLLAHGNEAPGTGDAIERAARALLEGRIVAVKGLGGFHLACRADRGDVVERLRARKHRDEKPFAVMVRTLADAERLAELADAERELLSSVERPIVLVRRRAGTSGRVSDAIAPGNPTLGLLLAYTPLHHLLLADAGVPLVMTSANLSDEPIVRANAEAFERLQGIADLFLVHDREIETRCDDSVARVIAGRPVVLRRSRGYVPRGIPVAAAFEHPVLATGAQLKNTFCVGVGRQAFLGPHIGDLENIATLDSFDASVERMLRFLRVEPALIAHDLHPAYPSTAWARERTPRVSLVGVQHHHAHVVAAMAEHGLAGPVLGLAFDGTGYGVDGTSWGGEFLLTEQDSFRRLATFRPLRLAGGDRAIRDVWRIALAMMDDAFGRDGWNVDDYVLFRGVRVHEIEVVRRMIDAEVNAPLAHGVGRWFDGFGALGLGKARSGFEGQVAMKWEFAASAAPGARAFEWTFDRSRDPMQIDLRPAVRAAALDLLAGVSPEIISARFHRTIVEASADVARFLLREAGRIPVVLTGGCFQNARLVEGLRAALEGAFDVRTHASVPPGDGGIALGQAVVANAQARKWGL